MAEGRPLGVTILGGLVVLAGVILLALSVLNLLVYAGSLAIDIAPEVSEDLFLIGAALNFILALILLVAGIGLLGLRGWAWWLAFFVSLVVVLRAIFVFVAGVATATLTSLLSASIGVGVSVLILGYLVSVRGHFR